MSTGNNNDYHYTEREKRLLEPYKECKSTRDIAKELRMSLRDISVILKKNQTSNGIAAMNDDNNNKSQSQKLLKPTNSMTKEKSL
ncbi:MAG TPA: hypothetical protein VIR31_04650 [Nitrososphaeraceae archaeon]